MGLSSNAWGCPKAWPLVILLFLWILTFNIQKINPGTFLLYRGQTQTFLVFMVCAGGALETWCGSSVLGSENKKSPTFLLLIFHDFQANLKPFWGLTGFEHLVLAIPRAPEAWLTAKQIFIELFRKCILPCCAEHYGNTTWERVRALKSVPSKMIAKE